MSFTFFDILNWTIIYLQYFVIAKIVIRDKTLALKEVVYVIVTSLLIAILLVVGVTILDVGATISTTVSPLLVIIYFYKIKSYPFSKTSMFTLVTIVMIGLNDVFIIMIANSFFPSFLPSIPNFPLPIGFSFNQFLQFTPYIVSTYILSCLTTRLLVKATKNQYDLIDQSAKAQKVLTIGTSVGIAVGILFVNIWRLSTATYGFPFWNAIALVSVFAVGFVSVMFYAGTLRERTALKERRIQQEYMVRLEMQQAGTRKFKHDYKNILLSIDAFVKEDDWDGLKRYIPDVRAASSVIITDEFALENLSKVKLLEIKVLLAEKLMVAQNIDIDVHSTFEADDEIDAIPINSAVLVRMLGIILDNAVEELQTLGKGQLSITCFKVGHAVNFVVKNTCRPDLPNIRQLNQPGYSTKGENRGLGLSNLLELVASTPNVALLTNIEDGYFIQRLIVGEEL